jgi:hypothetical protein
MDEPRLEENLSIGPFISVTPSKPLMSSGWLTLRNCEIYYLSAVIYEPETTDLESMFTQGLVWGTFYS